MSAPPLPVVLRGITNVVVVQRDGRTLLLGSATPDELKSRRIDPASVEWVLLTHHHRNACRGAAELAALGAKIAVPEAERVLFEHADRYWLDDARRFHSYDFHPSRCTLRESVPVTRGLVDGDRIEWRGVGITALATPGPSAGGLTYLVDAGGVRSAFVGELYAGKGKLRDFHLLQGCRAFAGGELVEYHGFGERAADVLASLKRVVDRSPHVVVPATGAVDKDGGQSLRLLHERLERCRASYHAVSAGRWYFPGVWPDVPDITAALRARCRPLPGWVLEVGGTSRSVVGPNGAALLIDCAGDAPERVRRLQEAGRLGRIEGLWITHYHDDHVDKVNPFRRAHGCPVVAHETAADILQRPDAYCMPCVHHEAVEVDRTTRDGEAWEWNGFKLTAYTLPGQTIYDAALLVERGPERVLFVGDSFTPGGLDDYCALNRNLLGPGLGYDRCLALLETLGEGLLLVNEHVNGAFVFSKEEIGSMRRELARRREMFAELLDWEEPNYGLDPQWARCDPWFQRVGPGEIVRWRIMVRNYGRVARSIRVNPVMPVGWQPKAAPEPQTVGAGREGVFLAEAVAPKASGRSVVGFAVRLGQRDHGEVCEGIVEAQ